MKNPLYLHCTTCDYRIHLLLLSSSLFWLFHANTALPCVVKCVSMCVSAERVSSGRLVGTFLSVCALTVLCGLVVVAVSRLLMQKRLRSSGGASGGQGHPCSGKVSCQMSWAAEGLWLRAGLVSPEFWKARRRPLLLKILKQEGWLLSVEGTAVPPNSQFIFYSFQIVDLTLTHSTFEKRNFMDICEYRRNISSGRMHFFCITYLNRLWHSCKQSYIFLTVFFFNFTSFWGR